MPGTLDFYNICTEKRGISMIQKAAEFAVKVHEGAVRKGSQLPYIVHPREVAMIVAMMTDDPEVIAAAYLHDVIEDAGVTYEEVKGLFGTRVADLVLEESEDKSKTWKERKQATIDRLATSGRDAKMIAFGDKLSNLRSTTTDYLVVGDEIWKKFREKDKQMHAWYYGTLRSAFEEFKEYPFYEEYCMLLHYVFQL
jgi:myo-inositol-1(or 4)-monophosphatase